MRDIFTLIGVFCAYLGTAQDYSSVKPLTIGDFIPDIKIDHIYNYDKSVFQFSDLKGKTIILDFWGINCAPCIKAFPKLEQLQGKFKDQLQIILISTPSKHWQDSVIKERNKFKVTIQIPDLPSITQDTVLRKLFLHKTIPHYVWIDPDGRVTAVTDGEAITEENIVNKIENSLYDLPEKRDLLFYNNNYALFPQVQQEGYLPKYYSAVSNYIPGLWGAGSVMPEIDTINYTARITRANTSILELFYETHDFANSYSLYADPEKDFGKRVILNVKDSNRVYYNSNSGISRKQWGILNSYCYELVIPLKKVDSIYHFMKLDLERYFNLKIHVETRKVPCLAIVRTSKNNKIKYEGNERYAQVDSLGIFHMKGAGIGLQTFRNKLSEANKNSPHLFIDKTGFIDKVQLKIYSPLNNIQQLRTELINFDLDIIEIETEVEFIIFSETEKE